MIKAFFISQVIKIKNFLYQHKLTYLTYASDLNYFIPEYNTLFDLKKLNILDKFSEVVLTKSNISPLYSVNPIFKKEEFLFKSQSNDKKFISKQKMTEE